jgi:hypothetical protein
MRDGIVSGPYHGLESLTQTSADARLQVQIGPGAPLAGFAQAGFAITAGAPAAIRERGDRVTRFSTGAEEIACHAAPRSAT